MNALVVNCSSPYYNLGAAKLADWLRGEGHRVETVSGDPGLFSYGFDLVALSVIFSALPAEYQEHILARYRDRGMDLLDANSGFEPRTFDTDTYQRWKAQLRGPWRFAFDTSDEAEDVQRMMGILAAESARRKQVYVLVGNEPIAACYERALRVIEWGGEPYCQPVMPLNALSRQDVMERCDWTRQLLRDFARYFNRHIWRSSPIWEYNDRKGEEPPFKNLRMAKMA